jgi:CDP-diglyceride synthetase
VLYKCSFMTLPMNTHADFDNVQQMKYVIGSGKIIYLKWYANLFKCAFYHIVQIFSLFNLLFFHNFHIFSLFNLLFFHNFHILSLFNLGFFRIFHIFMFNVDRFCCILMVIVIIWMKESVNERSYICVFGV